MIDLDEIWKNLRDYYGDDENNYRNSFYGAIGWDKVKAMMTELKSLRAVADAARNVKQTAMYDDDCLFKIERNEFHELRETLKNLEEARRG